MRRTLRVHERRIKERRNKLTPRFTKHTVNEDIGVTFVTKRKQKNTQVKKRIKTNLILIRSRIQMYIGLGTDNRCAKIKTGRSDRKDVAWGSESHGRSKDVRPYYKL